MTEEIEPRRTTLTLDHQLKHAFLEREIDTLHQTLKSNVDGLIFQNSQLVSKIEALESNMEALQKKVDKFKFRINELYENVIGQILHNSQNMNTIQNLNKKVDDRLGDVLDLINRLVKILCDKQIISDTDKSQISSNDIKR